MKLFTLFIITGFVLSACSHKTEPFETEPLSDYMRLQPGKYITYRVDSLVFPDFGRSTEIHYYQQKHVIDAQITDVLGRLSYRVFRYIRDSAGLQPWQTNGSYMITPTTDQVEIIEDNLRFVKLHLPMREGFGWSGNHYLPEDPYDYVTVNNSFDDGMVNWDFYYDRFETSLFYEGNTYTDVWTVESADKIHNIPIIVDAYGLKERSVDKYAKNIGLVYREYTLWEYQPNIGLPGGPYINGFGVTMWMIDHN